MKYHIFTYGCATNYADSERIARKLKMDGHNQASSEKEADLIVLNACSVRKSAMDRVFSKAHKYYGVKNKKVILAGCVLDPEKKKFEKKVDEIWHPDEYFYLAPNYSSELTAYIPITKGCDNFCSYCAVPYTRGREKSRPAGEIVKEARDLIKKNCKEIWLLGQNVNSYNSRGVDFPNLLKKINSIKGDFWIRFVSPHPKDFSNELIKTIAECEKVTEYINLPVQSGDNDILKKMNRKYTCEHFIKLVNKIRKRIPSATLSTDTIVGFPGETREQFANSLSLYKKLKFDMAFIAQYSPRPGTFSAMMMEDNIPKKEKVKRDEELTKILKKTALENNKKLIGQTIKVLIDSKKDGKLLGRTNGNKLVKIIYDEAGLRRKYIGGFVDVEIVKAEPWKLIAKIAPKKIITVLGPTSSGKSDLAVLIAQKFGNMEIISADSRQVYKNIPIGTGAVTKKEMGGIKHYLLNFLSPKKIYTAVDFKNDAEKAIQEIEAKGKLPIVCGGTGFYIDILLSGEDIPQVEPDWAFRKKLDKKSAEELFKMLKKLNPDRAKKIDPKNKRRLIRAIEISKSTTTFTTTSEVVVKKKYEVLYLGIKRDEKELKGLIEKRIRKMLQIGLLKEVKDLKASGVSWKRINELGFEYKYPAQFIRGKISKEEMIERMLLENYQYAKRQMTWFKKYAPETHWVRRKKAVSLSQPTLKLVKKFLEK